jgi:hypothetical protein
MGNFIVLELFGEPTVVVDPETGTVKYFENIIEAQAEADDCQEGLVIDLSGEQLITISKREHDGLRESHRMLVRGARRELKAQELLARHNLMWLLDQELDEPEATESRLKDNETLRLLVDALDRTKSFSAEQMFDVLMSMQMAISPELFDTSRCLDTTDFLDLPLCEAQRLGIEKEFRSYMNADKNFLDKFTESVDLPQD